VYSDRQQNAFESRANKHPSSIPSWANAKNPPGNLHQRVKKCHWVLSLHFTPSACSPCVDTAFTCLFCHHDKSVTVRLDRKEGVAHLVCRVCDQRYQSKVNRKSSLVSIYLCDLPLRQTSLKPLIFIPSGSTQQMPPREKGLHRVVQRHRAVTDLRRHQLPWTAMTMMSSLTAKTRSLLSF